MQAWPRGNGHHMSEPAAEPEPVDPGHEPGVDPPPDDDGDAVDQAEKLDDPERLEAPDQSWIASDLP